MASTESESRPLGALRTRPQRPPPLPHPEAFDTSHLTFHLFPRLPIELQSYIWAFAAERRPRIVQVFYNPNDQEWQACKDGLAGLPATRKVCRAARAAALKGYEPIFATLVDLQVDTIFISDPILTLRKQRAILLEMSCTKSLKNLAFTGDIFNGMTQSSHTFSAFCDSPAAFVRKFEQLEHLTLVLHEDGLEYDRENELLHFEDSDDDYQSEDDGMEPFGFDGAIDDSDDAGDLVEEIGDADSENEKMLESFEQEAFEVMSKRPYYRQIGSLHFESAYCSNDFWDSFDIYLHLLSENFENEKERDMKWKRPRLSIAEVKYGLKQVGDFNRCLHSNGDFDPLPLEHDAQEVTIDLAGHNSHTRA